MYARVNIKDIVSPGRTEAVDTDELILLSEIKIGKNYMDLVQSNLSMNLIRALVRGELTRVLVHIGA